MEHIIHAMKWIAPSIIILVALTLWIRSSMKTRKKKRLRKIYMRWMREMLENKPESSDIPYENAIALRYRHRGVVHIQDSSEKDDGTGIQLHETIYFYDNRENAGLTLPFNEGVCVYWPFDEQEIQELQSIRLSLAKWEQEFVPA